MIDSSTTAVIGGGSVEYSLDDAAISIQELIDALLEAQEDGATHVVAASGNYRGAKWERLSTHWTWADEE